MNDIKKLCPAAKVSGGLTIHGGSVRQAESDLSAWLKTTGVTA